MGDDSIVEAIGMGSILVEVMVKGRIGRIRIKDVLHVPKLHANLLSVSKILSSGCKVQFNMNECIVRAFDLGDCNSTTGKQLVSNDLHQGV
jgi:hypothetical protein